MNKAMGAKLKEIRLKADMSQGELAKKLGYGSAQFVSNWERGVCSVPPPKILAFCKATDMKTSEMRNLLVAEATRKIELILKINKK